MASLSSEMVKPILWVVKVEGKLKKSQIAGVSHVSGFSVRNDGVILTCAHTFSAFSRYEIRARRLDDEHFSETITLYERPTWDLLLLKVLGINDCKSGELAADGTLSEGDTLFHVGNPLEFVGSFMIGHACYQCVEDVDLPITSVSATCATYVSDALARTPRYRIMGHIWNKYVIDVLKQKGVECPYEKNLNPLVPIIQCNAFTCAEGCSGGPIFNARGEIVGMLAGESDKYTFGLHVTILREFVRLGFESEKEMTSDNPKGEGKIQSQGYTYQASSKRMKR